MGKAQGSALDPSRGCELPPPLPGLPLGTAGVLQAPVGGCSKAAWGALGWQQLRDAVSAAGFPQDPGNAKLMCRGAVLGLQEPCKNQGVFSSCWKPQSPGTP